MLEQMKQDYFIAKRQAETLTGELNVRRAATQEAVDRLWAAHKAENAELIETVASTQAALDSQEKAFREAIIAAWPGGNASKTVAEGLSVRVTPKPVYDEAAAIKWAIDKNLPDLLKLNSVEFKKAAGVLKPDFVTFESSVTAVITAE
jgi:hypothetical protein